MASRSNKTLRYAQPANVSSAPKTPPRSSIANAVRSTVANQTPKANYQRQVKFLPYRTGSPANNPTDASGNRLGGRRQVGEADAATRRAALNNALKPGPAVKPAPVAPQPAAQSYDGGGMGNKKRRKVIDETVDRMSR